MTYQEITYNHVSLVDCAFASMTEYFNDKLGEGRSSLEQFSSISDRFNFDQALDLDNYANLSIYNAEVGSFFSRFKDANGNNIELGLDLMAEQSADQIIAYLMRFVSGYYYSILEPEQSYSVYHQNWPIPDSIKAACFYSAKIAAIRELISEDEGYFFDQDSGEILSQPTCTYNSTTGSQGSLTTRTHFVQSAIKFRGFDLIYAIQVQVISNGSITVALGNDTSVPQALSVIDEETWEPLEARSIAQTIVNRSVSAIKMIDVLSKVRNSQLNAGSLYDIFRDEIERGNTSMFELYTGLSSLMPSANNVSLNSGVSLLKALFSKAAGLFDSGGEANNVYSSSISALNYSLRTSFFDSLGDVIIQTASTIVPLIMAIIHPIVGMLGFALSSLISGYVSVITGTSQDMHAQIVDYGGLAVFPLPLLKATELVPANKVSWVPDGIKNRNSWMLQTTFITIIGTTDYTESSDNPLSISYEVYANISYGWWQNSDAPSPSSNPGDGLKCRNVTNNAEISFGELAVDDLCYGLGRESVSGGGFDSFVPVDYVKQPGLTYRDQMSVMWSISPNESINSQAKYNYCRLLSGSLPEDVSYWPGYHEWNATECMLFYGSSVGLMLATMNVLLSFSNGANQASTGVYFNTFMYPLLQGYGIAHLSGPYSGDYPGMNGHAVSYNRLGNDTTWDGLIAAYNKTVDTFKQRWEGTATDLSLLGSFSFLNFCYHITRSMSVNVSGDTVNTTMIGDALYHNDPLKGFYPILISDRVASMDFLFSLPSLSSRAGITTALITAGLVAATAVAAAAAIGIKRGLNKMMTKKYQTIQNKLDKLKKAKGDKLDAGTKDAQRSIRSYNRWATLLGFSHLSQQSGYEIGLASSGQSVMPLIANSLLKTDEVESSGVAVDLSPVISLIR